MVYFSAQQPRTGHPRCAAVSAPNGEWTGSALRARPPAHSQGARLAEAEGDVEFSIIIQLRSVQ